MSKVYDFTFDELDEAGALELPMPHLGDLRTIHPIFQRGNFPDLTDVEYAAIRPCLALCSAYLAESFDMQIFWHTILFGKRHPIPNTPDWHVVLPPFPPFTEAHYQAFDALVMHMAFMFAFEFAPCDETSEIEAWGQTQSWDRAAVDPSFRRPAGIEGFCSVITLSPTFLEEAVAAQTYLASLPVNATPDAATLCRILRQQWFFAVTTVHELAHGFNNAQMRHQEEPEPFFEPHRRAEVGYAWEQYMHGGQVGQIHMSRACDCGLSFRTWPPGAESHEVIGPQGLDTGYGWNRWASQSNEEEVIGRLWNTEYLVPMRHIQKLHTRHFWEVEVRRFGLATLHIPKTLGLRTGNSTRAARLAAGSKSGSVSGGDSRDWIPDPDGRVWRGFGQ